MGIKVILNIKKKELVLYLVYYGRLNLVEISRKRNNMIYLILEISS